MNNNPKRGVYFLANNKVYEPTVAFLNSFREYNPDIDLCFIPFDEAHDRIIELKESYNFTVYENQNILRQCDFISKQFHEKSLGAYRKLAIWEGEFEEFAYIDIDTLVLSNIDFAFAHLKHTEIFTSFSNIEASKSWVWKDSIHGLDVLTLEQIDFAANTGFIVSTRKKIDLEFAYSKLSAAVKLKDHMTLMCMEQPFLNYLIVTSGKRYGSLFCFLTRMKSTNIKLELWAGNTLAKSEGGRLIPTNAMPTIFQDNPIFLLHWAGPWLGPDFNGYDEMPYFNLWNHYRHLK